jgi:hypothetical protein
VLRLALLGLLVVAVACGPIGTTPLGQVQVVPPALSPGLRSQANRWDVHYYLNSPATVSTRIVGSDGQQWPIASNVARPTRGDYVLQFDGTVAGPGANERRVLPDGDYQLFLDVQSGGQQQQVTVPLAVRGADTTIPAVTDVSLLPDHISPNFDAIEDVTHVTYRLAKDALVSAFLDGTTPSGATTRIWAGDEVQTAAGEQSLTWDGTANGQPVPNGEYQLGVRARDQAGNIVESSQTLVVEDSGVPEASIVSAHIGPLQIIRGDEVCVDAIVRNTGQTVLRTEGPDPGYVYNSLDTFGSIENHMYAEHAGFWRVGLSWSGSTDVSGATYPYRWGFGHDLQPDEEVTVHGCVRIQNEQDTLIYFAGLVQENVAIHNAGAGLVRIHISS